MKGHIVLLLTRTLKVLWTITFAQSRIRNIVQRIRQVANAFFIVYMYLNLENFEYYSV